MLSLTLPGRLVLDWKPILGEQENWRVARKEGDLLLTFLSNGKVAAYPGYSLLLCTLHAEYSVEQQYAPEYRVPYIIVSDRGTRKDDFLTISLVERRDDLE